MELDEEASRKHHTYRQNLHTDNLTLPTPSYMAQEPIKRNYTPYVMGVALTLALGSLSNYLYQDLANDYSGETVSTIPQIPPPITQSAKAVPSELETFLVTKSD